MLRKCGLMSDWFIFAILLSPTVFIPKFWEIDLAPPPLSRSSLIDLPILLHFNYPFTVFLNFESSLILQVLRFNTKWYNETLNFVSPCIIVQFK
jgi:hypothetical protein